MKYQVVQQPIFRHAQMLRCGYTLVPFYWLIENLLWDGFEAQQKYHPDGESQIVDIDGYRNLVGNNQRRTCFRQTVLQRCKWQKDAKKWHVSSARGGQSYSKMEKHDKAVQVQ